MPRVRLCANKVEGEVYWAQLAWQCTAKRLNFVKIGAMHSLATK